MVYAVGNKITRTTNGSTWAGDFSPLGLTGWLRAVSGPPEDANVAWAVGETGAPAQAQILHTANGTSWTFQTVPDAVKTNLLNDVSAASSLVAYAVGNGGTILKTIDGGANWSVVPSGVGQTTLMGVVALNETHVVVVGEHGTIRRTVDGGANWTSDVSGSSAYLNEVSLVDWNTGWAVGDNGTILRTTNGSTWTQQISPAANHINAVDAANAQVAWAAGENSALIHTTTGGEGTPIAASAYFAEGCTRAGFNEWISLQNPGTSDIVVYASYIYQDGTPAVTKAYDVKAQSRTSVNVNADAGAGQDVSARLYSSGVFFAERSMYFSYTSFSAPGEVWTGGNVAAAAASARSDWYFAEGCTRPGFEEWITVLNPGDTNATVTYDFITPEGEKITKTYGAPAGKRTSMYVNWEVGANRDVSAHVYSTTPIVVERPMYFNYGGWTGGSDVMGARQPAKKWYFAEGCTRAGFQEYLCLQNPGTSPATVTVIYHMPDENLTQDYTVEAGSRRTIDVNGEVGPNRDVSCEISSTASIVVERPLYFAYTGYSAPNWTGGSDVLGATVLKTDWYFPEGYTGPGFHEYLCIMNTGTTDVTVNVTYNILNGTPKTVAHTVAAGKRYTVFTNADAGMNLEFSMHVAASAPVMCERAMYFDYSGWDGGSCGTGFAQ